MRPKREALAAALESRVPPVQRRGRTALLAQIDSLDETIGRCDAEIARRTAGQAAVSQRLDASAGVGPEVIQGILAEIGTDISGWGRAERLAAWCGVAPGNNRSAGQRHSGKTRPGNQ
jgi:transposase